MFSASWNTLTSRAPPRRWSTSRWLALAASLAGCDGGAPDRDAGTAPPDAGSAVDSGAAGGTLSVILEAEDTITDGIAAGDTGAVIRDGWMVAFDSYVVVIGDIDVHLATDEGVEAEAPELYAVDLVSVSEAGLPLWTLTGLQTGRWEFNYAIGGAGDGATRHDSVPEPVFAEMVAEDATYLISGELSRPDGQSCPPSAVATPGAAVANGNTNANGEPCYDNPTIGFRLLIPAETAFGPCEIDEVPGFAITGGGATTVAATVHGDHLFFNGFPEGDEGGVTRLAQWLADCDLNVDGEVTRAELELVAPADLAELDARFQLGGSPITPLQDMWDYVTAQVKTQGHFQGEGECPFDGLAHMHD
ncbi:MAG: hypothetical protein H6719_07290 [Sandaracinaceae bacterium]|nr:hypothetical protein [Sandaracinaceae bacterium]